MEQEERTHYSREFKHRVIAEFLRGNVQISELQRTYGIKKHGAIRNWIRQLGYESVAQKSGSLVDIIPPLLKKSSKDSRKLSSNEQLEKRIKELERQLQDEQLRSEGYRRMIDIAEMELKIPIRKKSSTK